MEGSGHYDLMAAWGSALLGRPRPATEVRLVCNASKPGATALRHFESFAEEPSYAFFSPHPLRAVEVRDWVEQLALAQHPKLAMHLSRLKEPPHGALKRTVASRRCSGNPFAALLTQHGIPQVGIPAPFELQNGQVSMPFRGSCMVLCILYALGKRSWLSGHSDLEVLEVGGGYGALAWTAARAALARWSPELGFRTWSVFDLPHVSALQAREMRETPAFSARRSGICWSRCPKPYASSAAGSERGQR